MERMYYINHKIFEKGDTCSALSFALKLRNQDQSITTITLLVPQRDNYSDFLEYRIFPTAYHRVFAIFVYCFIWVSITY